MDFSAVPSASGAVIPDKMDRVGTRAETCGRRAALRLAGVHALVGSGCMVPHRDVHAMADFMSPCQQTAATPMARGEEWPPELEVLCAAEVSAAAGRGGMWGGM